MSNHFDELIVLHVLKTLGYIFVFQSCEPITADCDFQEVGPKETIQSLTVYLKVLQQHATLELY